MIFGVFAPAQSPLIDLRSMESVLEHLLYLSPTRDLLYVTDVSTAPLSAAKNNALVPSHVFEHLSCFISGLLALGASTLTPADGLSEADRELHMWAAKGLGYSCWITYQDFEAGLGPDEVVMDHVPTTSGDPHESKWLPAVKQWIVDGRPGGVPPGLAEVPPKGKGERDYWARRPSYHLRPEVRLGGFLMIGKVSVDGANTSVVHDRPWRVSTIYGVRLVKRCGANEDGRCSRRSRRNARLMRVMQVLGTWRWVGLAGRMNSQVGF